MTNPEIPEEAVAAAAQAFYGGAYLVPDGEMNDLLKQGARAALAAALPHLRVQETPEAERIDWSTCHCGSNADGHLMGYCAHCSSVRCDAYPGACNPTPHPRPVVDREALIADRTGENALTEWLEEVFSTDEDAITWEMAAKALFDLGAVREPAPLPAKADVIAVVRKVVYAEFGTFDGPVDRIADAVLALLPTEEGEGS